MNLLLQAVVVQELPADGHENRTRLGMLAGWASTVMSALMAAAKFFLGAASGSVSMIADATNNLTDMGSSLVIALGFQWSRKPRDEDHPFGHGRIEAVATLVLAIALILVGTEVARSGIMRLVRPQPIEAPVWLLVAVGVTVAVKAWMAVFARQLARLSKSQVLEADAWNHTFDIVSTFMVVVALVCSKFGWGAVDGWMAIGVAGFILYTGVAYAREAIDILLGQKPDPDEVRQIFKTVLAVEGVMSVHEIMVHHYGDVKMVSFHIEVDANMSLVDAHLVSERAEDEVEKHFNWRALAHLDPVDRSHPLFEELNDALHWFIRNDPCLVDVHDLRAEGEAPPYRISFDLVTDMETRRSDYDAIYQKCLSTMERVFGERINHVEIGIEAAVESAPMARRKYDLPQV
ncbi:Ferrous-iron efflux pump FieF [Pontiella desulfatans]|uniref:Ferrous-iron efflux pump FieF n=2 Tax=Pontiella desulfatans TaxID=2750659 RepID=A0A6C2U1H2_PONDE|nr:Ferrous-iron efflux pump FieF [Pontiella desulfatans]